MPSEIFNKLKEAIVNLDQVEFDYDGYHRITCPHVLGYKGDNEHVLVYQFGGASSTPLPSEGAWRCIKID